MTLIPFKLNVNLRKIVLFRTVFEKMRLLFLVLGYQTTIISCLFLYTCPLGPLVTDRLIGLRESILCNKEINCKKLKETFLGTYRKNIIILLTGSALWSDVLPVIGNLSRCGIRSTILNGFDDDNVTGLANLCSRDKITVVLTWSNSSFNFIENVELNSTCVLRNLRLNQSQISIGPIVSYCPHTAWIIGHSVCNSSTNHKTARVHFLGDDEFFSRESKPLKIVTIPYKIYIFNDTENGTVSYSGPIVELINIFANKYNLSYDIYPSVDNKYGVQDSDGNWNGMIGMLQRKEADMAAAAITITESRSEVVDFTAPFYSEPYAILIYKPKNVNKLWNALLVFNSQSWVAILGSAVAVVFTTYLIHKFAAKPANTGFEQVGGCVWYVTAGMVNQAGEIEPSAWSGRNLLAFWWLYVVAIIAIYGGLLVAQLSTDRTALPFKNLAELARVAKEGRYKFCLPDSTVIHEAVKKANTSEYKLLRDIINQHSEYVKHEDICMELAKNSTEFAIINELSQLSRFQKSNCEHNQTIILSDNFLPGYLAFALPKGSPLRDLISFEIREAFDAGLILMWKMLSFIQHAEKKYCDIATPDDVVKSATQQLGLVDVAGSFAMLSIGICVSLLIFTFELFRYLPRDLFHCVSKRQKQKNQ